MLRPKDWDLSMISNETEETQAQIRDWVKEIEIFHTKEKTLLIALPTSSPNAEEFKTVMEKVTRANGASLQSAQVSDSLEDEKTTVKRQWFEILL